MIQKRSQHGPKFNSRLVKNQTKIVQKYLGASWDVPVAWTRLGGVLEHSWEHVEGLQNHPKMTTKRCQRGPKFNAKSFKNPQKNRPEIAPRSIWGASWAVLVASTRL